MGPRLFSVEYEICFGDIRETSKLQWGHAYSAWNTVTTLHDRSAAIGSFNGATLIQRGIPNTAQFHSKFRLCFNGATLIQRGIHSGSSCRTPATSWLQWGHAYSAWNTKVDEVHRVIVRKLQWGHAYSAWNTRHVGEHHQRLAMLQWGHAYSAWNTLENERLVGTVQVASMGPRLFSVEYD